MLQQPLPPRLGQPGAGGEFQQHRIADIEPEKDAKRDHGDERAREHGKLQSPLDQQAEAEQQIEGHVEVDRPSLGQDRTP